MVQKNWLLIAQSVTICLVIMLVGFIRIPNVRATTANTSCDLNFNLQITPLQSSGLSDECSVAGFHTTRGILEGVTVNVQTEVESSAALENLNLESSLISADWNSIIQVGDIITESPFGVLDFAEGFDGVEDFEGLSTRQFPAVSVLEQSQELVNDPNSLSNFYTPEPAGDVSLPITVSANVLSIRDNISAEIQIDISLKVEIEYLYNLPDVALLLNIPNTASSNSVIEGELLVVNLGQAKIPNSFSIDISTSQSTIVGTNDEKFEVVSEAGYLQHTITVQDQFIAELDSLKSISIPIQLAVNDLDGEYLSVVGNIDLQIQERNKENNFVAKDIEYYDLVDIQSIKVNESVSNSEPLVLHSVLLNSSEYSDDFSNIKILDLFTSEVGNFEIGESGAEALILQPGVALTTSTLIRFVPIDGGEGVVRLVYTLEGDGISSNPISLSFTVESGVSETSVVTVDRDYQYGSDFSESQLVYSRTDSGNKTIARTGVSRNSEILKNLLGTSQDVATTVTDFICIKSN